jgi:hypothetical protein
MSKSEKIKLKGRELATRLTGILTQMGGISWKPPVDERDKARRLLLYLAGQRALHYPYDREIGTFIVQSILDTSERLTRDIEALSTDSLLRKILRAMQAACRKFLDENQSPSAQDMGGLKMLNSTAHWVSCEPYLESTSLGFFQTCYVVGRSLSMGCNPTWNCWTRSPEREPVAGRVQ